MPEPETTPPGADETCGCCTFGNHTEPCTCDGSNCCHPEKHRPAVPVPGLRDQIAGVFRAVDGEFPAWTKRDAGPEAHVDAVMAVVQPVIDKAQQRAETAEVMTAEVTEALRLANRELDAAATKWDLDLDKRTADLTQRAENAEAAVARVRDLVADMQGVTGVRWWAALLAAALTPPVPADQPEGGVV